MSARSARHDILGALPERRSQLERAIGPDVVGTPWQVHALDERRTEHHADRGRLDSDRLTHDSNRGTARPPVSTPPPSRSSVGHRGDGRRLTPDTAVVSIERGAARIGRVPPSPSARLRSTAFPGRPCRAGCRARRRAPGRSRPTHRRARAGTTPAPTVPTKGRDSPRQRSTARPGTGVRPRPQPLCRSVRGAGVACLSRAGAPNPCGRLRCPPTP